MTASAWVNTSSKLNRAYIELFGKGVELFRVEVGGVSCPETGLLTPYGGGRGQQLGKLGYCVVGTWQLDVFG